MKTSWIVVAALAISVAAVHARWNAPGETQTDLNASAAKELEAAQSEMTQVLTLLAKRGAGKPEAIAMLNRAQAAWEQYRDAQLRWAWPDPARARYGSVYPMCVANERARLTKARTEELRAMLSRPTGDSCAPVWPN